MRTTHLVLAAVVGSVVLLTSGVSPAHADDYSDPDYRSYDLDNMARTTERQGYHFTSDDYLEASRETFFDTWLQGLARQFRDADEGRAYAGLGQILPGGNVGDPETYHEGPRFEVEFLNREGTKLVGNVWPCRRWLAGHPAGCPGIVITTGSIQVTQHMYGWLARHLQDHGYSVFTFDVRGQGESETTDQEDPFGSNPQDGANFQNGTVDALRFFLSSESRGYVPVGWSDDDVAEAKASGTNAAWFNPASGSVDADHLGLIGHSLGASAVSVVQQCTTTAELPEGESLPAACAGERFPIKAIVAYDSLSGGVTPLVPAFDHRSDGYFINAVPTTEAPPTDQRVNTASPYGVWVAAGVDACSITGRGFTHAEWSQIPSIVSATRYGVPQAKHYTRAWLDRFVHPHPVANRAGQRALLEGPIPDEVPGRHLDHRASLFSGKYDSACSVTGVAGEPSLVAANLREYAGVADVGDWAAINEEKEYGTATQGAAHLPSTMDATGI